MKNYENSIINLHQQFIRLGRERNKITYKLLFLLPKILEFEIYKKYNYSTIYEYAGRLAGLSHSVVQKALAVHRNLEGKPCLQKAVENQGIHKVALVAKLASPKTDAAFADKVKNMSKHSLCELAREMRMRRKAGGGTGSVEKVGDGAGGGEKVEDAFLYHATSEENGNRSPSFPCHAAPGKIKIELDDEMQFLFLKLKKSMMRRGVKIGSHLSNKEVLRRILREAEPCAEQGKAEPCVDLCKAEPRTSTKFSREKNSKEIQADVNKREMVTRRADIKKRETTDRKVSSRYVPAHQKKAVLLKSNGKCAYPGCLKPADVFHHTQRFSEVKNNQSSYQGDHQDSRQNCHQSIHKSVTPLCKTHHEFAHNGLIGNEEMAASKWRLNVEVGVNTYADTFYRERRRK